LSHLGYNPRDAWWGIPRIGSPFAAAWPRGRMLACRKARRGRCDAYLSMLKASVGLTKSRSRRTGSPGTKG
jgi:hypothetical protein